MSITSQTSAAQASTLSDSTPAARSPRRAMVVPPATAPGADSPG